MRVPIASPSHLAHLIDTPEYLLLFPKTLVEYHNFPLIMDAGPQSQSEPAIPVDYGST